MSHEELVDAPDSKRIVAPRLCTLETGISSLWDKSVH